MNLRMSFDAHCGSSEQLTAIQSADLSSQIYRI